MNRIPISILACIISLTSFSQNKTYNNTVVSPKNVTFKTYNYVNSENKKYILRVDKYIDTSKPIFINAGIKFGTTMKLLRAGAQAINVGGKNLIDLKVEKGRLLITVEVRNMDWTLIGQIKNNELKPEPTKDYPFYFAGSHMESIGYGKPYAYLSQTERDIMLYKIQVIASQYLKPKHE